MGELVSVIVPVYNAERFLGECIQSIITQVYQDIEVLLIDDGSTDSSGEICNKFVAIDSRVHYYKSENCGVSAARNKGLDLAKGEYICFVDSDDLLERDYIEKLYSEIHKNHTDVAFCNYQYLYGDRKLKKAPRIVAGEYTFKDITDIAIDDGTLSGILFGSVWGAIYNSTTIKNYKIYFDGSIKRNEDGLFNLCILQKSSCFSVMEYDGYLYRQWKKTKSKSLEISSETEKATEKIKECCCGILSLEKQLKCRKASVIFWNTTSLAGRKRSIVSICRAINKYVKENSINEYYQYLDMTKINRVKKILISMLNKGHTFAFVFSIKYLYPLFGKIIKR